MYRRWPVGGIDGVRRATGGGAVGTDGAFARIFARITSLGDSGGVGGEAAANGLGGGAALLGVACCLIRARASWLDAMDVRGPTPGPAKRRRASASEIKVI